MRFLLSIKNEPSLVVPVAAILRLQMSPLKERNSALHPQICSHDISIDMSFSTCFSENFDIL